MREQLDLKQIRERFKEASHPWPMSGDLAAYARTDIPALIQEVEQLREENADLQFEIKRHHQDFEKWEDIAARGFGKLAWIEQLEQAVYEMHFDRPLSDQSASTVEKVLEEREEPPLTAVGRDMARAIRLLRGKVILNRHLYLRDPASGAGNCWCGNPSYMPQYHE